MHRKINIVLAMIVACLVLVSCSKKNGGGISVTPEMISAGSDLTAIIKRGKIMVGMDVSDIRYQPFEMKDTNGKIVGYDVDLAQMMADDLGVTLEIVPTNWDGIIPALIAGKFDLIISAMAVTTERNKAINFSHPYYLSGKSFLVNIRDAFRIKTYRDLNKKDIVITTTYADDMVLDRYVPDADIVRYESDEEAVKEVVEGRADAYIADKTRVILFSKKYPKNVVDGEELFTFEPIAVGIRKGDVDLLNWVDNFIQIVRGDGRLAVVEKKWMQDYIPPSTETK